MTTIAYRDGVIAYDSLVTAGGTVIYDDFDKKRERNGVLFFGSGSTADIDLLISAYFGEIPGFDMDARALVLREDKLSLISFADGRVYESEVLPDRPYAIGSGSDHAYTAFDMGASARQAVELAAKRDTCTGGLIRTFTLPQG
ncbi:proteasome subunit beta [Pseudomonas sp. PDM23]|uniref:proteasome subunit beta n=1 Tax=unclassified Pseudomonas TaxID=196821 RepID=UPI001785BC91|nr:MULTISPECIES: proteasome subunit beta [unclassified Pseudomonas]MBD9573742.1 proteasome subunit beta [Pseudomonas sp. PDM23]MBD9671578.1 proteasome subunit beta [Pseudomonas sp. PDM21]